MRCGIQWPKEDIVQAVFGRIPDLEFAYHDSGNAKFFFGALSQIVKQPDARQCAFDYPHVFGIEMLLV